MIGFNFTNIIRFVGRPTYSTSCRTHFGELKNAFIGFGSNLGDRVNFIENALKLIRRGLPETHHGPISIKKMSSLWRSRPMYYTQQDDFFNGVFQVETTLDPWELLRYLQSIEKYLGRKRSIVNGPRCIDLDILLYEDCVIKHELLSIPHIRILERPFVLRPLCELAPHQIIQLPGSLGSVSKNLSRVKEAADELMPLTVLSKRFQPIPSNWERLTSTLVMGVYNATPDSFSDAKRYYNLNSNQIRQSLENFIPYTHILDIGGQSSRPGADIISPSEELERITPVLNQVKSFNFPVVSIDTFNSQTAKIALDMGVDIVNDVTAGRYDLAMFSLIEDRQATIILCHSEGNSETMLQIAKLFDHENPDDTISRVATSLLNHVDLAQQAGIPPWRIILDPGLGFAKLARHSVNIIANFSKLRNYPGLENFTWLIGPSKKSFHSFIIENNSRKLSPLTPHLPPNPPDPTPRLTSLNESSRAAPLAPELLFSATTASVAAAIAHGASIIRVHDVRLMFPVISVADALFRPGWK